MLMLNRAFFSLQMPWGPTRIAVATLVANGVLDALFYRPFGVWGIPLATSFVNVIGTFLLVALAETDRRPVRDAALPPGDDRDRRSRRPCSPACPTASGTGSTTLLGRTLPAQFVSLLVGLARAGGLVYLRTGAPARPGRDAGARQPCAVRGSEPLRLP